MAVVKGSRQYRMKVVPDRPLLTFWLRTALVLLMVAAVAGAWWYGRWQGQSEGAEALRERVELRQQFQGLVEANASLRAQLTVLDQELALDRETLGSLQRSILSLREMNSQAQQDVL